MSMVINPSSEGSGATTPTTLQSDLTISDFTQMLFKQHLVVGSKSIIVGTAASLLSV